MRFIFACALVWLLAACGDDQPVFEDPRTVDVASYAAVPTNKLDVLFLIDNTAVDMQLNLATSIAPLFTTLASLPGGLDLRLGVTTSDLGTSSSNDRTAPGPSLGSCMGQGDDGRLVQVATNIVADAYLVDEPDGAGGRDRNYTGDLAAAVGTMIKVGGAGCGFEQTIAATSRAFDNPQNAGFVREDANLLIVMLSDEDDCSVKSAALFQAESAELGPLQSYRCTQFGVVCDEPLDAEGPKTHCRSNEESELIDPVEPYVERIQRVKPDSARVGVYAMSGPPTPFASELRTPPGEVTPSLALAHSCRYDGAVGPEVADPAVRLSQFARAFGANGAFDDDCAADLTPRVHEAAQIASRMTGVVCLDTTELGDSDTLAGVQPSCSVRVDTGAGTDARAIPACGETSDDCFEIATDAAACPDSVDHARLVVHLSSPTPGEYVRASCFAPL